MPSAWALLAPDLPRSRVAGNLLPGIRSGSPVERVVLLYLPLHERSSTHRCYVIAFTFCFWSFRITLRGDRGSFVFSYFLVQYLLYSYYLFRGCTLIVVFGVRGRFVRPVSSAHIRRIPRVSRARPVNRSVSFGLRVSVAVGRGAAGRGRGRGVARPSGIRDDTPLREYGTV